MTYVTQQRQTGRQHHIYVGQSGATLSPAFSEPVGVMPHQTTYSFRGRPGTRDDSPEGWLRDAESGRRLPPHVARFDTGHDFWTSRCTHRYSHPRWLDDYVLSDGNYMRYQGPLVPQLSSTVSTQWGTYPVLSRLTPTETKSEGTRFINETIPTAPSVSVAQFIGELRDLPRLIGKGVIAERANVYRGLGSEYLNVQFGWIPFVDDLLGVVRALRSKSQILTQYHRDAGRVVRRKRVASPVTTSSSTTKSSSSTNPALVGGRTLGRVYFPSAVQTTPVEVEDIVSYTYSFSGAYTYHLPISDGTLGRLQRFEAEANRLLGTRVTPSVLWELAPWSWLIDWHGEIGMALENASALAGDELVLRYGYLMRETLQQRTYRVRGLTFSSGKDPGTISHTLRRLTKERVRANPYGFTLAPTAYSTRQWAILTALGMTRAPRVLR